MRRGTFVLIAFILVVGAIIAVSLLLQNQPAFEVTIAVNPLAEEWAKEAARAFNETDTIVNATRRVQINVVTVNDVDVWNEDIDWNLNEHPTAWLPASSVSVEYTPTNLPFRIVENSLARTPLVWGGFASRVELLTGQTGTFDWSSVAESAANWNYAQNGNINMALNYPTNSMAGVGVLFTAVADFNASPTFERASFNNSDFEAWFQPIIDITRNAERIGGNPAQEMASRRVADVALLPESQWLQRLDSLNDTETMVFAYPQYQFVLDFPLVIWDDTGTTDDERAAIAAFGDWLLNANSQTMLIDFGLRPVSGELTAETGTIFALAEPYGIALEPDLGNAVEAPGRNEAQTLIELFD